MLNSSSGISIVYFLIAIVISLSIHEATHAYVAHILGDTTAQDMGRLSLNPLKHIDPMTTVVLPIITLIIFHFPVLAAKPVPMNPTRVKYHEYGSAIIAGAGPISNFLLAILGAILINIITSGPMNDFLSIFIDLNVSLFVFNMLPIPPLDGSRILYAVAPESVQEFMQFIEPYGLFIIFGLILTGILWPLFFNLNTYVLQILP